MHGEYKTPGGKLVVADFLVSDGALREVTISGDFFLYPEDALGAITARLREHRAPRPRTNWRRAFARRSARR